jgi:hypothetical protein
MAAWIFGLGTLAAVFAVMAIWGFVKVYRKPPPVWDTSKEWGGRSGMTDFALPALRGQTRLENNNHDVGQGA